MYYYFYQLLKNEAEAQARRSRKLGNADASVGMLTSLVTAALAGYKFISQSTLPVYIFTFPFNFCLCTLLVMAFHSQLMCGGFLIHISKVQDAMRLTISENDVVRFLEVSSGLWNSDCQILKNRVGADAQMYY